MPLGTVAINMMAAKLQRGPISALERMLGTVDQLGARHELVFSGLQGRSKILRWCVWGCAYL